ncbi:MAG: UDP-N-acetylmuramate--L-alanine ligase, partial [Chloroflexi bacterium]|nr:UDP-N-acetylmuramate--L-alanine ligase [Chloroflexota bacterium]
ARGLASCRGTARRLETLATVAGVTVVDDYAHHPTELRASLDAMRTRVREGRLVALFQPHMASRTDAFRDAFADALRLADLRMVAATFPSAREPDDGGASARDLAARADALFAAGNDEAARALAAAVRPGDIVLVMGAGDVRAAAERLVALLVGTAR